MKSAVIYDCEFLTQEGAMSRFWTGAHDPDPLLVQIGAVRVSLQKGFPVEEEFNCFVMPVDRYGSAVVPNNFFCELTGISAETIDREGLELEEALQKFSDFSGGNTGSYWAWGKDELFMLGMNCFIQNVKSPIQADRFGNMKSIFIKAGMSSDDVHTHSSGQLAQFFCLKEDASLRAHDGLDDALSILAALRHLERAHGLDPECLEL